MHVKRMLSVLSWPLWPDVGIPLTQNILLFFSVAHKQGRIVLGVGPVTHENNV